MPDKITLLKELNKIKNEIDKKIKEEDKLRNKIKKLAKETDDNRYLIKKINSEIKQLTDTFNSKSVELLEIELEENSLNK